MTKRAYVCRACGATLGHIRTDRRGVRQFVPADETRRVRYLEARDRAM